jgi:hypothetical protein
MKTTALALFAACLARVATAHAQTAPTTTFQLEYSVPANDGCPAESAFRARLASRLGEDPVRPEAPLAVRVSVERSGARRRGAMAVRDASGTSLGQRAFPETADACAALVDTIALSLSLFVQERARETPAAPTLAPHVEPVILVPALPPSARVTSVAPTPEEPPPPPPTPEGIEVALRVGYGSFTVTDAGAWVTRNSTSITRYSTPDAFSGSVSLDGSVGWRFTPHFSVGARGAWQHIRPVSGDNDVRAWTLGVYARWYLFPGVARGAIDPWFGLGVDALARFDTRIDTLLTSTGATFKGTVSEHAVALPMSLGVDVHLADRFALGVSGALSWWITWEHCIDTTLGTLATDTCNSTGAPTTLPGATPVGVEYSLADNTWWSVALDLRYTFGL